MFLTVTSITFSPRGSICCLAKGLSAVPTPKSHLRLKFKKQKVEKEWYRIWFYIKYAGDEDPIVRNADVVQARDDGGEEDSRTSGEFSNKFY